jgi:acyl-CoA hydrolase
VDAVIGTVGRRIVLGLPLALGKANHLANAFYRRAREDSSLDLTIYTALTLEPPGAPNALAARLLDPVVERIYGGYPELDYARDRRAGTLPANVTVKEFFLPPGGLLKNDYAQRNYVSANYTHAARDILAAGINVIAQMVAPEPGGERLSLSCNTDLILDLVPVMRAREAAGEPVAILGEINADLPFLGHEAAVAPDWFDGLFDAGRYTLFAVPAPKVSLADHAIGLRAAALVRDGGTLQLGIGALSDAVSWAIRLRQEEPEGYRAAFHALTPEDRREISEAIGGLEPFETGLYACSEMLTDGLLDLLERGIVRRTVQEDIGAERAVARGEAEPPQPGAGVCMHAGFYLGPVHMYERLRRLPQHHRNAIGMRAISHINDLFGEEDLARLQRRQARFINSAMRVNGRGAAISDALDDGRVVSGVGGQYNFAAMAHALKDGRSVILLRSTRTSGGETRSNIVWTGGEVTVPRHLRDIVVTEYGVADLRGATDREVAVALAELSDARFQDDFVAAARAAGKIEPGYSLPDSARCNTPDALRSMLDPALNAGLLPDYPFGSELCDAEKALKDALEYLGQHTARLSGRLGTVWQAVTGGRPAAWTHPLLERMGFAAPDRPGEWLEARLVAHALQRTRRPPADTSRG